MSDGIGFKLEGDAIAPFAPSQCSAICGNCTHYQPHRDSKTGRVHPSKQGRCGWKPNIKWAMAYRRNGYGWREQDPMVYPVGVWKNTDAKTCACFSPNDQAKPQPLADAVERKGGGQ